LAGAGEILEQEHAVPVEGRFHVGAQMAIISGGKPGQGWVMGHGGRIA
jgi:hypothetical protein